AKFEKLPFGKYKYKETIAPNGYLLNEETFEFEIKKDGQIIKHVVEDQKKPVAPGTTEKPKDNTPKEEQPTKVQEKEQVKEQVKEQPKKESLFTWLPKTGGEPTNWISAIVGFVLLVAGGIFLVKRKNA
ncbi:TPA: LPXTG cell wall anchor domain-containing protein, partial [Bacillus cytotoxicus]|nr:LPXTG cell wall anchor domain-containing protein [Bacillus cytotoxicus]